MNIIFLLTQTFQEFNKTGIDNLLLYVSQSSPVFIPFMLFSIFFIILFTTYSGTKMAKGTGDIILSFVTASMITSLFSLVLRLKEGLINNTILGVVVGLTIVSLLLLFFSGKRD